MTFFCMHTKSHPQQKVHKRFQKHVFGAVRDAKNDTPQPDEPRRTSRTSKSVGAIVLNQKLQVLLIFQQQNKYWEFPKGKMEAGEDEVATLKREINEETGIRKFRLVHNFRKLMYYTFRFEGSTIRRSVVYYLIQTGDPIQLSDEHSQYMWLSFDAAKKKLKHKNQIKLLDQVTELIYG